MSLIDRARRLLGQGYGDTRSGRHATRDSGASPLTPLLYRQEAGLLWKVPMFAPFSAGAYEDLARLTILTINDVFPRLAELCRAAGARTAKVVTAEGFAADPSDRESANRLKEFLDRHGSDKASGHTYHLVYGRVLRDRAAVRSLLEIGLGTHHADVVSNMGASGRPGSSLRAFRDFLPNAQIFGADVDRRILFEEERILTHFVDQNDVKSFEPLGRLVGSELDVIIDDGLHTPSANLAVVLFALEHLRIGGWLIVEDILPAAQPVWEVVAALVPAEFETYIISTDSSLLFAARRAASFA